jgi:hypothetical protein
LVCCAEGLSGSCLEVQKRFIWSQAITKGMYWKILRDGIGVSSPKMLDHSIFHLHINVGYILLVLYVDDIVIARDESGGVTRLKQFLQ